MNKTELTKIEKYLTSAQDLADEAGKAAKKAGFDTLAARAIGTVAQSGYALEAVPEAKGLIERADDQAKAEAEAKNAKKPAEA